jgi:hypothetical protein
MEACISLPNGSSLSAMRVDNAESLADSSRTAGVGPEQLRSDRGVAEDLVAALVEDRKPRTHDISFAFTPGPVGPAEGDHALGSERPPVVRGELPGEVDPGAGVCNLPDLPRRG